MEPQNGPVVIPVIAVISGLTCNRGERVNSALGIDPLASFVCLSKQKNIQLTAGLTLITAIDHMWKML